MSFELPNYPDTPIQHREQWRERCRITWNHVQTLIHEGVIVRCVIAHLFEGDGPCGRALLSSYGIRNAMFPLQRVGTCVLMVDKDHEVTLGGSFCAARDRKRYTTVEGMARAAMARQPVIPMDALTLSEHSRELAHLPPSCRRLGKQMLWNYQMTVGTAMIGSQVVSKRTTSG